MMSVVWNQWQRWIARHIENDSQVWQQSDVIGKFATMSLLAALLLAVYAWNRVSSNVVLVWLACLIFVVTLWLTLRFVSFKFDTRGLLPPRFAALHVLIVTCVGFLWGLTIWVFSVPQDFNGSIVVVTTQAAVAMMGWLFFSGFFPALLMYSLGVFVPTALTYAAHADYAHTALCLMLHIIFVLQGRKVIEVIRIRHEKEALVQQLQQDQPD